jgi:histidinol-phosphatase (PHP family)
MIDGHIHFEKQPYSLDIVDLMVGEARKHHLDEIWLLDHTHKFREFNFLYEPLSSHILTYNWYHRKQFISIEEYLDFIRLIRSRNYDLRIRFGLEVCYIPKKEEELRKELSKYDLDFLLGSVHFIDSIGFDLSKEAWDGVDVNFMYRRYYEIMERLIRSDLFTTLAHPDSIKVYGHYPEYDLRPTYRRIARLLYEHHMSTENNTGLWRYHHEDIGLNSTFLSILKEEHVDVHPASDAHEFQYIGKYFDVISHD